jgi:hypothetical protein
MRRPNFSRRKHTPRDIELVANELGEDVWQASVHDVGRIFQIHNFDARQLAYELEQVEH